MKTSELKFQLNLAEIEIDRLSGDLEIATKFKRTHDKSVEEFKSALREEIEKLKDEYEVGRTDYDNGNFNALNRVMELIDSVTPTT